MEMDSHFRSLFHLPTADLLGAFFIFIRSPPFIFIHSRRLTYLAYQSQRTRPPTLSLTKRPVFALLVWLVPQTKVQYLQLLSLHHKKRNNHVLTCYLISLRDRSECCGTLQHDMQTRGRQCRAANECHTYATECRTPVFFHWIPC